MVPPAQDPVYDKTLRQLLLHLRQHRARRRPRRTPLPAIQLPDEVEVREEPTEAAKKAAEDVERAERDAELHKENAERLQKAADEANREKTAADAELARLTGEGKTTGTEVEEARKRVADAEAAATKADQESKIAQGDAEKAKAAVEERKKKAEVQQEKANSWNWDKGMGRLAKLAAVLLGMRMLWGLEHQHPGGCQSMDSDNFLPGKELSLDDWTMLVKDGINFFSVNEPKGCTGHACTFCTAGTALDKTSPHSTSYIHPITSDMVHTYYTDAWCKAQDPCPPVSNGYCVQKEDGTCGAAPDKNSCPEEPAPGSDYGTTVGGFPAYVQDSSETTTTGIFTKTTHIKPSVPIPASATAPSGTLEQLKEYAFAGGQKTPEGKANAYRNLFRRNDYACKNSKNRKLCNQGKQNVLCRHALTCEDCTDGSVAQVCAWTLEDDAAGAKLCGDKDQGSCAPPCTWKKELKTCMFLPPTDCSALKQNPACADKSEANCKPPCIMDEKTHTCKLNASCQLRDPYLHPEWDKTINDFNGKPVPNQAVPQQLRTQIASRPQGYIWKMPTATDIQRADYCHQLGGLWNAPEQNESGYGWACISGTSKTPKLTAFGDPDHVIDFQDCNCSAGKQCWKAITFQPCDNCSGLDMFGLNPTNPGGPFTTAAHNMLGGVFSILSSLGSVAKTIVEVLIVVCILCVCWSCFKK